MRKKLQDTMFEISYLFELLVSVIVGIAILIFAARMITDLFGMAVYTDGASSLLSVLDDAIILAIGAELIKMLCKHTPETVLEVIAFALAHHLIVSHGAPMDNLITVLAIVALFVVRKFLLKRQDMVETPDGLVSLWNKGKKDEEQKSSDEKIHEGEKS